MFNFIGSFLSAIWNTIFWLLSLPFKLIGFIWHLVLGVLQYVFAFFLVILLSFFPSATATVPPDSPTINNTVHVSTHKFSPTPDVIQKVGNKIIVQLPKDRVEDKVYKDFVVSGICNNAWISNNKLKSAKSIYVLNKFQRQGFVFENHRDTCQNINSEPEGRYKEVAIGRYTHSYMPTSPSESYHSY
jgi:hypothetical protein